MTPAGVIRPISLLIKSVNQRFPSGPATIPTGSESPPGIGNSVMTPAGVIRPILLAFSSVNQRFPSGPAAMPPGPLPAVVTVNSVNVCPPRREAERIPMDRTRARGTLQTPGEA